MFWDKISFHLYDGNIESIWEEVKLGTVDEVLAFDTGIDVVGILEIGTGEYTAYRGLKRMAEGARRLLKAREIISYNGNRYDLKELASILGFSSVEELIIEGTHYDMQEICWNPIFGSDLVFTYEENYGTSPIASPDYVTDSYEIDNYRDAFRAAELYRSWKKGTLKRATEMSPP